MVDRRSQALQDQFKKSVRKARVAGIDTRRGPKTDIKQRNTGVNIDTGKGNGRDQFIANQAFRDQSDRNFQKQMQEQIHRNAINKMRSGVMDKSDFTGYTGGLLGLRTGNFKDNVLQRGKHVYPGASTWGSVNPETGNLAKQLKVREGMTSPQYSEYMRGLFATDPSLFHETFPAGKFVQNLMTKGLGGEKQPFTPEFSDPYVEDLFEEQEEGVPYDPTTIQGDNRIFNQLMKQKDFNIGLDPHMENLKLKEISSTSPGTSMMEDYYSRAPGFQQGLDYLVNKAGMGTVIPTTLTEKQEDYVTSDMRKVPYNIETRGLASVLNQLEGVVNDPNKPFLDQGSGGFLGFGGSDPQEPATKQEILNSLVEKGIVDINKITSQDLEQAGVTLPTIGLAGGGLASLNPYSDYNKMQNSNSYYGGF